VGRDAFRASSREKEKPEGTIYRAPTVMALLGASAQYAQDYAGGDPVIVLLRAGAESGAVIVDIEETNIPTAGRVDIDAAADFI
jgi:hypothetical protein